MCMHSIFDVLPIPHLIRITSMIYFCLDKEKIKYVSGIAEHELLMTDDNNADDDAMANSILHTLKRIY